MKIVGIIGEPAVGKTTFMKKIISKLGKGKIVAEGPVKYHKFEKKNIIVIGLYDKEDQVFCGLDKLWKGIGPTFRAWLSEKAKKDLKGWTLLWEGERFSNNPMLSFMYKLVPDTKIYLMIASPETLAQRHALRKDSQSSSWLKGMKTRMENIRKTYPVIISNPPHRKILSGLKLN